MKKITQCAKGIRKTAAPRQDNVNSDKLSRYAELTESINAQEKEKEALKKELLESYGSSGSYLKEDSGFAVELKTVESKRFDTESFRQKHEALYNEFAKPSFSKIFTVKKIMTLHG